MSAPTQPTTRPRPSNSLLRRRQRRATANLLVRGVGPGGGKQSPPWRLPPPGSTPGSLPEDFLQWEGNFYPGPAVILTTARVTASPPSHHPGPRRRIAVRRGRLDN